MFKLKDRIKETSYTQGLGEMILRGATQGFSSFASSYNNDDSFFYCIASNDQYEIGLGRYGTTNNSLLRDELIQSSTGGFINWGKGLKEIYVTYSAEKSVHRTPNNEYNPVSGEFVLAFWKDGNSLGNVGNDLHYDEVNSRLVIPELSSETIIPESIVIGSGYSIDWNGTQQTLASVNITLDNATRINEVIEESGYADHTLGFKKQSPATVFAGPLNDCGGSPCDPDYPSFRPLLAGDIPPIDAENVNYGPTTSGDWDDIPTNVHEALDTLAKYGDKFLQRNNNLSDVTNKALARFNLGVDGSGQDNSIDVTLVGENYLTIDNQQGITVHRVRLDNSNVSGILPLANIPVKNESGLDSNSELHLPTQFSVKQYVDNNIALLVDSAPEALDTLKELSDALSGDANFAATISNQLGNKLDKNLNLSDITNVEAARANLGVGPSGNFDSAVWGQISGTLTDQNDLSNALNNKEDAFSKNAAFNKNFGSTNDTVCEGSDPRLSDARTPLAHTHDDRYYTETEVDQLIEDNIYQPFLDITEYDNAPNYKYYGGVDENGDWQINRYPRTNLINDDTATSGNNITYANLSAAWIARSGLTYA